MYDMDGFKEFLKKYKDDEKTTDKYLGIIHDLHKYLDQYNQGDEKYPMDVIRKFATDHIAGKEDALSRIIAVLRFFSYVDEKSIVTYFLTMTGTIGVLENIKARAERFADRETADRVFSGLKIPPLGSPYEMYPPAVEKMMKKLTDAVDGKTACKILAGNNHGLSAEGKALEKKRFDEIKDIDAYLIDYHDRKVKELQHHMEEDKIWFESKITPEIVKYVSDNPEVLGGVRIGDEIFVTKFPYDPENYLKEKDPVKKRYYGCHCAFARSSIIDGSAKIDPKWCNCSGGFNKHLFDVIFDADTEVRVTESVLAGDSRCRFAIKIPEDR